MNTGKIVSALDHGTMWQLLYQIDGDGLGSVYFDHRPFAHFYEGATGRSFFDDYRFGAGREYVSKALKDLRIYVDESEDGEVVRLGDQLYEG